MMVLMVQKFGTDKFHQYEISQFRTANGVYLFGRLLVLCGWQCGQTFYHIVYAYNGFVHYVGIVTMMAANVNKPRFLIRLLIRPVTKTGSRLEMDNDWLENAARHCDLDIRQMITGSCHINRYLIQQIAIRHKTGTVNHSNRESTCFKIESYVNQNFKKYPVCKSLYHQLY